MYRNVVLIRWFGILVVILERPVLDGKDDLEEQKHHPEGAGMPDGTLPAVCVMPLMQHNILVNLARSMSPASWGCRRPDSRLYSEVEKSSMQHMSLENVINVVYGMGLLLFICSCSLSGQQDLSFYIFNCSLFLLCVWDWYSPVLIFPTLLTRGITC